MNACNEEFIKKNNISGIDNKIYTNRDINWIVYKYEVEGNKYRDIVCMEDLVGFHNPSNDIELEFPGVLDNFFDNNGNGYMSRAVSMLKYDENTIMEGLKDSFEKEPISTFVVDKKKHVILSNGMHRFLVLRALYLKERENCTNDKEIFELNKKYTIPVETVENDMTKTYCKYLIDIFQPASIMDSYFSEIIDDRLPNTDKKYSVIKYGNFKDEKVYLSDEDYDNYSVSIISIQPEYNDAGVTGRSVVKYFDGTRLVIDDDSLLELTSDAITSSFKAKEILEDTMPYSFNEFMEKYDSFRDFVNTNFSNEINNIKVGVIDGNKVR